MANQNSVQDVVSCTRLTTQCPHMDPNYSGQDAVKQHWSLCTVMFVILTCVKIEQRNISHISPRFIELYPKSSSWTLLNAQNTLIIISNFTVNNVSWHFAHIVVRFKLCQIVRRNKKFLKTIWKNYRRFHVQTLNLRRWTENRF